MIQKGHWRGYYNFSDPEINKARRFQQTNFDIEIVTVIGNAFAGIVTDDLLTGGTQGTGEIKGRVDG